MHFQYTDGKNKDFIQLCHFLDDFLNSIVGGEENRMKYIPYNTLDDINNVIVIYDGNKPVGCAGFKKYNNKCAEVKRVFIRRGYRERGLSRKLMEVLENWARNQGYFFFILESGEPLIAAMKLYYSIGYEKIPNYGQYLNMTDSVCMKKTL
ncbi:GNAT family N-acetyltransferase [Pectinatus haikarae]|uniref:GNAT family N-acetyltransferase n=1 Tax=Pectinatus haikarae TaxID=349096 RepID=UPI0018C5F32E|nr:GNAT family N-acetyltransferase [Pectinatus haikarae]